MRQRRRRPVSQLSRPVTVKRVGISFSPNLGDLNERDSVSSSFFAELTLGPQRNATQRNATQRGIPAKFRIPRNLDIPKSKQLATMESTSKHANEPLSDIYILDLV